MLSLPLPTLSAASALLLSFTILASLYLLLTVYSYLRLSHIPGPFLASLSHLWVFRTAVSGRTSETYLAVQQKYGPLVRVGPNYLLTNDPTVLRRIGGARSKYGRDSWYAGARFHPTQDTVVSLLVTSEHDRYKSKVLGGYSGRERGQDAERGIDEQIGRLIRLIREKFVCKAGESKFVDLVTLSRSFTLDVITKLGYGKEFGFMDSEDGDLYGYAATAEQVIQVVTACVDVPWLRAVLFSPLVLRLFGPKHKDRKGLGRLMDITRGLVMRRFGNDAEKQAGKDMLGSFIRNGLTQKECEAEVILALIAGSDTTATALRMTMLYIMTAPLVYQRLKREIKQAVEEKRASSPITAEEAKKLPYLQAVIWEGFRMCPPAIYGHFKSVPPEGDTILGKFVPGGTAIGHNLIALSRSEEIFGPDAYVFRPERFLESDTEKKLEMDRALDLMFGHGRWTCAGKSVATLELNKIYFELFRRFDFQVVNPERPWERRDSYVIYVHKNIQVKITETDIWDER